MLNSLTKEIQSLLDIKRTYFIMQVLIAVGYGTDVLKYESYIKEEVEKHEQSNESIINTVRCYIMTDRKLKTS